MDQMTVMKSERTRRGGGGDAPAFSAALQTGAALVMLVRNGLGDYGAALQRVMASDAPEGAHRARIALRRLRSVLKAGRSMMNPALVAPVAERAGILSRMLGEMRDADVMIGYIDPVLEPERRLAFTEAAAVTRARVRLQLVAAGADRFPAEAEAVFGGLHWRGSGKRVRQALQAPVGSFATVALSQAWARARKHGKRIDLLDEEDRHSFRKDMKTLRYLLEYFTPLWSESRSADFIHRMRGLQDRLGLLNDLATLERLQAEAPVVAGSVLADAAAARAEQHEAGLIAAQSDWKALRKLGPFW